MVARIYKPSRSVMKTGPAYRDYWILEYEPEQPRWADPLMGWTSSDDMRQQVQLKFATKEDAESYAQRNGIPYRVIQARERRTIPKSYSDNFRWRRPEPWTH